MTYTGETNEEGYPKGEGVYVSEDGAQYDGIWKEDDEGEGYPFMIGQGFVSYSDGSRYEGQWSSELDMGIDPYELVKHGNGTMEWADGDRYEGEWNRDWPGVGTMEWANGDRFKGSWDDGNCANGTMEWANGDVFVGMMDHTTFWGPSGQIDRPRSPSREQPLFWAGVLVCANGDRFEGEWDDDVRTDIPSYGKGVYERANGDRFDGEWKEGFPFFGKGVFEHANGDRYDGQWKDGRAHGRGVVEWTDGTRSEGGFKEGSFHGRIFRTTASGVEITMLWENGKHVSTEPVPSLSREALTLELLKLREEVKRMRESDSDRDEGPN